MLQSVHNIPPLRLLPGHSLPQLHGTPSHSAALPKLICMCFPQAATPPPSTPQRSSISRAHLQGLLSRGPLLGRRGLLLLCAWNIFSLSFSDFGVCVFFFFFFSWYFYCSSPKVKKVYSPLILGSKINWLPVMQSVHLELLQSQSFLCYTASRPSPSFHYRYWNDAFWILDFCT